MNEPNLRVNGLPNIATVWVYYFLLLEDRDDKLLVKKHACHSMPSELSSSRQESMLPLCFLTMFCMTSLGVRSTKKLPQLFCTTDTDLSIMPNPPARISTLQNKVTRK